MLDIGWSELLVIGIVALIVVGPKDLPKMFRALGEFTGKARRMAREFQTAMNDAAGETGVNDIASDLRKMANPKQFGMDKLKEATDELKPWNPDEATKGTGTAKDKIAANAAKMAEERRAREAAEAAAEPALVPDPDAPKAPEPEAKA
jgi:sec-independent protein translocase protein TatB